jgi:hypothetical protein
VLFSSFPRSSSYKWRQDRVTDLLEYTSRVTIELNICQLHPEAPPTSSNTSKRSQGCVTNSLEHTAVSLLS